MRKLEITELGRMTAEEYKESKKTPLIVVLDNVRSMHNVGSVFRTADAYRIEKIFLCGITSCPPNAEIHKSALGAEFSVEWEYAEDTAEVVKKLRSDGVYVYAVEQAEGSEKLDSMTIAEREKFAIVLGNEVKGVRQDVVDMSDGCIELPQYGTKHSLNVSVTAGIVIWEMFGKIAKMK